MAPHVWLESLALTPGIKELENSFKKKNSRNLDYSASSLQTTLWLYLPVAAISLISSDSRDEAVSPQDSDLFKFTIKMQAGICPNIPIAMTVPKPVPILTVALSLFYFWRWNLNISPHFMIL